MSDDLITWKPPSRGRFPYAHELRRVTDADVENRVVKLRADVNCAVDKIDKALAASRGTAPSGRLYTRAAATPPQLRIEYSRHGGKILDIR